MKWLRVILFLFIPIISFSQDTVLITPGSKLLRSSELKNYSAKYDFYRYDKNGERTKVGGLEEEFTVTGKGNARQGLRVCNITFGTNKILDSGLCQLNGLKPIYHRSIQTSKKMSFDFNDKKVNGIVTMNGANTTDQFRYDATVPLFDSYYEDMIARTLKFREGLVFKFPEYIYERGGTVWSTGEVKIDGRGKEGQGIMWQVIFYEKNNEGKTIRTTTYLVDQRLKADDGHEKGIKIFSREYKTETGRIVMEPRD